MDEISNNKQNHKVTIFAILLSIISLGVLVFGFIIVSSDKVVMLQSISNLYNKVNGSFEDEFVLINRIANSKDCGINTKNTLTIGNDIYNINVNYLENRFDKRNSLDLSIMSNDNLLSANYFVDNNILYTFINGVTEDYYNEDSKYSYASFLKNLTQSDYEKLLALLKEEVSNIITNDKIDKEKVTIDYNNSPKKVTKLTYKMTSSDIKTIVKDLIKEVKNDKNLTKNILSFLDTDAIKFIEDVDKYLEKIANNDKDYIYSYSTYYYGFNKIIKYEFYSNVDDILFSYLDETTIETIDIKNSDNTVFNLIINNDKKNYQFNGNISYFIDKFNLNKDNYFVNLLSKKFTGTYDGTHLELIIDENDDDKLKLNLTLNLGTTDNVYKYNSNLNVSRISEEEKVLYNIASEIEFIFDKKIDIDVAGSINYNELLEEDKKVLEDNLNNNYIYQIIRDNRLLEYFN